MAAWPLSALAWLLLLAVPGQTQQYTACPNPYPPCDPSQCGSWSAILDWSDDLNPHNCAPGSSYQEISHAALIVVGQHRGKVLHWRQGFDPSCVPSPDAETQFWLFNPQSPGQLEKLEQELSVDYFCAGLGWDRNIRLTVAGGFPPGGTGVAPKELLRFDPRLLRATTFPPSGPPIVPGNALLEHQDFVMSIERYYPGIAALDRRPIDSDCFGSQVPGGSQVVFGGPPTISNEGNELWQFLDPMAAPGASAVLQTLEIEPNTPGSVHVTGGRPGRAGGRGFRARGGT